MAYSYADMVKETSTTTGTGTYDLAGPAVGFRTFVAGVGDAATVYYCCTDGVDWEVGYGVVTDAATDTLSRTVVSSSNADALVNWSAGEKSIFLVNPAANITAGSSVYAQSTEPANWKIGDIWIETP